MNQNNKSLNHRCLPIETEDKLVTSEINNVSTNNQQPELNYLVKLEGINKYYQSGDEKVHALKNISLELPKKGLVFVLGQSGCGKSTLLNILGGLDKPDEGRILIEGADFSKFTTANLNDYLNSYLGFIFQEYNILKDLNLYDNIALPLEMQNVNKKEIKKKTLEIIDQVGLSALKKSKINQLSGGQRQRIAVARALIKDPKMIIADEPTGNLDSVTGETIFELLKKLSENRLVLIVTHDEESAYRFGDRIIKIEDGQLIEDIVSPFTENDK
jgi:putative ABC transport system ATP-binding protein